MEGRLLQTLQLSLVLPGIPDQPTAPNLIRTCLFVERSLSRLRAKILKSLGMLQTSCYKLAVSNEKRFFAGGCPLLVIQLRHVRGMDFV